MAVKVSSAKTLPAPPQRDRRLAGVLERLYARYNRREYVASDPLCFVYNYPGRADMEIVALLCACLAYGRVSQIQSSLADLLARMGPSPFDFTASFDGRKGRLLASFKHRFTNGSDIAGLLTALKHALQNYGSIERLFSSCLRPQEPDVTAALSRFRRELLSGMNSGNRRRVTRGLYYLLCDTADGSACKRLNLFLRWMVRKDEVDPGLWKSVDRAKLIVPVDTHMSRLCRILGLYDRKTVSLEADVEITRSFARIVPGDPVKYDFALSRIGIVKNCDGRYRRRCELCELSGCCRPVRSEK
jgi:uncharacterized protein (TIGR02757 family)